MNTEIFDQLLKESEKMEALLSLTQKVLPEIRTIISFSEDIIPSWRILIRTIKEVYPLISEMKESIEESNKNLPEATSRLDKITVETENVAENIMDSIDSVIEMIDENKNNSEIILNTLSSIKISSVSRKKLTKLVKENQERHDKLINLNYEIMNHLQFQDITSQQINHANSIIETLLDRFKKLLNIYDGSVRKERAFDSNATMHHGEDRQNSADSVFTETESNINSETKTSKAVFSQKEIDKLANKETKPKSKNIKSNTESTSRENFSQDKIDKLLTDNL